MKNNNDTFISKCVLDGYKDLEPSTVVLIKAAIKHGINYEVINEDKSFIRLYNDKKEEYIVQATKTSKDKCTFPYLSDNKLLVKDILRKSGISVPLGVELDNSMNQRDKNELINEYVDKCVVVKPNSTNCGIGITVFDKPASFKDIKNAVEKAFKYDSRVIMEDYKKGKEYRFIVIDNKCVAVIQRRNASVVGDGKSTIEELIDKKNHETWHLIPERFIIIDKSLKTILSKQGYQLDSVPKKDVRVFCRMNSNISTGGESIDVTNIVPDFFKNVAVKATKQFNASICGVDILIDDLNVEEYSIVELNDNPGIGICECPYEGEGQPIGEVILKLLGFI